MAAIPITAPAGLSQQLSAVSHQKIYFGHQSVGLNILEGIRDLAAHGPQPSLRIVHFDNPALLTGSGIFESSVGQNGDPQSKNAAFADALDKDLGTQVGIAFYKYCYVDFSAHSDVKSVFARYRDNVDALRAKYPSLKIVHVTVPLTTVESAGKAWIKAVLRRETARDANARRNEFNRLLKETYRNDPIFDLAEIESTHPDGSRESFISDGQTIYNLCPEYTSDGGHLNALGRGRAAEKLIALLAQV